VGIDFGLHAGRYECRILVFGRDKIFSFLQIFQAISGGHPVSYWIVTWGFPSRTRRPGSGTLPVCCKINP